MSIRRYSLGLSMKWFLAVLLLTLCSTSVLAGYRTWRDKKGNSINAELINTFGGKIVLQDKNGKIYKLDPTKLSEADQLYLNPPPPKYKIVLSKSSKQKSPQNLNHDAEERTTIVEYSFALKVQFLTDDPKPEGLGGVLFVMGRDAQGQKVVIDKAEGTIESLESDSGQLKGKGFESKITRNKEGKHIQGIRYDGYLIMLLASDGTILQKQASDGFLTSDPEKTLMLEIGDRFNQKLEKL